MLLVHFCSSILQFSFLITFILGIDHLVEQYRHRRNGSTPTYSSPARFSQVSRLGFRMLWESYKNLRSGSYLELVWGRFKEIGNTFTFYQLGSRGILTNDPQNVKAILATRFQDFGLGSKRETYFEPFIGHGIFTADGQAWRRSRQLVRPCFSSANLEDMSRFEKYFQLFLQHLPSVHAAEIDLQELFLRLTLDIATDFLFGQSTSVLVSDNAKKGERFAKAFRRSQEAMLQSFALGWISGWLPQSKQAEEDKAVMRDFVAPFVHQAIASRGADSTTTNTTAESRYNFAAELATYTRNPELISGSLLNILLAGRDTTASLLSSLFFVLGRRPSIFEKLKSEISEATNHSGECPALEQLRSMPYLRACVNECLRLYPPIPRNSRIALRDTSLPMGGGPDGTQAILVKKGTEVGYQVYSMHRRKDIYGDDAEEFIPERWMRPGFRPGWAFIPFNGGPRICLGQQFALNQAFYVTARLLQHLETLKPVDDMPWVEDLGLSCSLRHGVRVFLKRKG